MKYKSKYFMWNILFATLSVLLLVSSIIHKSQMQYGNEVYKNSNLIGLSVNIMIILWLFHFINIFVFIYFRKKGMFKREVITLLVGGFVFVMQCVSIIIDSPTLVYMT